MGRNLDGKLDFNEALFWLLEHFFSSTMQCNVKAVCDFPREQRLSKVPIISLCLSRCLATLLATIFTSFQFVRIFKFSVQSFAVNSANLKLWSCTVIYKVMHPDGSQAKSSTI